MTPPIIATVETGSVIVACTLLLILGAIMIAAIVRGGIDGAIRVWGVLGTLIGLVVGTMGTYFFTKDANMKEVARVSAEKSAVANENVTLRNALSASEKEKARLGDEVSRLAQNVQTEQPTNTELLKATASELRDVGEQLKRKPSSDLLITPEKPR